MKLEWDGKVGPATVIGFVGSLSVLVTLGMIWGVTTSKIDNNAIKTEELKVTTEQMNKHAISRDAKVAEQAERLKGIEASVGFIVPAIQRIESRLDALPRP